MEARSIATEKDGGEGEERRGGEYRVRQGYGLQTVFSIIALQIIKDIASADNPI